MTDEEFEHAVQDGIDAIPDRFLRELDNVAIVIADVPSPEQKRIMELRGDDDLLGLYEGIPLTDRGESYGGLVLPDKITIFKHATLAEAKGDSGVVRMIVRDTVWHEIAHYFGYNDDEIKRREDEGINHST